MQQILPASFRDPAGFLFTLDSVLYRQVNQSYRNNFDHLLNSGLYERLVKSRALVAHQPAAGIPSPAPELAYQIIQPERIPFISYPYEWSFSQLKDAALLTLSIQKKALDAGMALKDASAYNIQFRGSRPVLIDTLSFEIYVEGQPWVAYRQFCQHFLAPLALMALSDVRLNQLSRVYIDGVPLDLAARLLPWQSRLNFGLGMHIHTHAGAQKRYAGEAVRASNAAAGRNMSKMALLGLIDNLENTIRKLDWKPQGTEWGDYYTATNYTTEGFEQKRELVRTFLARIQPRTVWDLGANTAEFSQLAAEQGAYTIAWDIDPAAVEKAYRAAKKAKSAALLPLVQDLTNPSPALGWHHQERMSLSERAPVDVVLALALVHHLAISNNLPLSSLAAMFAQTSRWLIIEFVPKEDSQVQRLLASREDIFPAYHRTGFEDAFRQYFTIHEAVDIPSTRRTLYLMEKS